MKRGPKPREPLNGRFRKLRGRLIEIGMSHRELALTIDRSHAAVSLKMTAQRQWTLEEMYLVCKALGIPAEQMHIYFPLDGKDVAA